MFKILGKRMLLNSVVLCMMFVLVNGQQSETRTDKTAPTKTDQKDTRNTRLAGQDREFVMKVAEGNSKEIALAKTGTTKATNFIVRQYAQRLVDDHTKMGEELKSWAMNNGVTLPADDAKAKNKGDSQSKMMDMDKLNGADYDREFMRHMLKDHQKDVALFERQSREGQNQELKAWVDKTLPTLREHLQMAKDVGAKVGVSDTAMEDKGRKGGSVSAKPPQN